MAFKKKTWIDRMVEFAGRRKITNVSTSAAQIIDVERAEGAVSQEGDAFSAENMNDLEKRISDAFTDVPGYKIADNDTTNNSEFLATARVAYEHGLEIDALSRDLGGCSFEQDGVDFYIVGADAVRKKLTGNDIYEIAYDEGNGWAGKETIQLDVTNIPDYATLSLDSFKYVALLSSSGTGGATEEITGSYMGVKVLGYDSGSGKLSIQTANAYRPIFIVVIE